MKKKEDTKKILDLAGTMSAKQIILLREELDIDDEMNEEESKEIDDDPYFLLAQRLANAPQVKVGIILVFTLSFFFFILPLYIKRYVLLCK